MSSIMYYFSYKTKIYFPIQSNHYNLFFQITKVKEEPETGRAFPYKLYYSSNHNSGETSPSKYQEENDLESRSTDEVLDYKYNYPQPNKWRRVGQRIDRTFDIIAGVFQSATIQVSQHFYLYIHHLT